MPRGHVKHPGSLPRPPNWNSCRRFCKYCALGEVPATPVIAAAAVGEVGEPSPFFESSSELAISLACLKGRPRLSRRATEEADEEPVGPLLLVRLLLVGTVVDGSRESFAVRLPYLFFK